jgi:hypothetical protein
MPVRDLREEPVTTPNAATGGDTDFEGMHTALAAMNALAERVEEVRWMALVLGGAITKASSALQRGTDLLSVTGASGTQFTRAVESFIAVARGNALNEALSDLSLAAKAVGATLAARLKSEVAQREARRLELLRHLRGDASSDGRAVNPSDRALNQVLEEFAEFERKLLDSVEAQIAIASRMSSGVVQTVTRDRHQDERGRRAERPPPRREGADAMQGEGPSAFKHGSHGPGSRRRRG